MGSSRSMRFGARAISFASASRALSPPESESVTASAASPEKAKRAAHALASAGVHSGRAASSTSSTLTPLGMSACSWSYHAGTTPVPSRSLPEMAGRRPASV